MPKNKTRNTKPSKGNRNGNRKQPKQKRVRVPMQMSSNSHVSKAASLICANTNPFCSAAYNAKLYDTNTSPSLTYSNRQIVAVSSDANGFCGLSISSNPTQSAAFSTNVAGVTTAWFAFVPSTFFTQLTATNIGSVRVVSYGFKFITTAAWTTATGLLIVTESNEVPALFVGQNLTSAQQGARAAITPIRDADLHVIGRPLGMASLEYQPENGNMNYTNYMLSFSGFPINSVIGSLELVINYEWIPNPSVAFVNLATQAAPSVPTVLEGRAHVLSTTNNLIMHGDTERVDTDIMSKAMGYVNTASDVVNTVGKAYDTVTSNQKLFGAMKIAGTMLSIL